MLGYALVSLNVPLRKSTYTYSYKKELGDVLYKRVSVSFGTRSMTGFVVALVEDPGVVDYEIKEIIKVQDKERVVNEELVFLASRMSFLYKCSSGQALSLMVPNAKREVDYSPFSNESSFSRIDKLTAEQEKVIGIYHESLEKGRRQFYLYGITGSGKSEVYLRLAEERIRQGYQVLYLVPEITLTEQISKSVYERFNRRVAFLHSSLTPSQRFKNANAIRNGEVDLVIGARSAVFAPFRNLGLIILDEEHENTYKSGNTPRYHARQIAQLRSEYNRCPLIMGSATPSLEAYHLMQTGRLVVLRMYSRIGEGAFPHVRIVNMAQEQGSISRILRKEMEEELGKGNGIILFLNRRGYSPAIVCNTCKESLKCPNCSVNLTYHKGRRKLICHTCGYTSPLPSVCPSCQSRDLSSRGSGTEMIEDEVRNLFPFAKVLRLDSDAAESDKAYISNAISSFEKGEVDILLGTQMIAKGLNFPKVTLVGIINADSSLFSPDFRANERTFALLEQVSGRAGRFRKDGKVVVQTTQIVNPAILALESQEQERFYAEELECRREIGFPPFGRLVNFTVRGHDEEKVVREAEEISSYLSSLFSFLPDTEVYDANPCMVEKKSTYFRYHVMVRTSDEEFLKLLKALDYFMDNYRLSYSLYLEIDVDPLDIS